MGNWNFADVWEAIAAAQPDATAQVHGDRRSTWGDFDRRADGVGRALLAAGLGRQDKVALYLYNGPEYLEGLFASMKAGLVPVNTNYRYGADELAYLWDNADARAVVFHGSFTDTIEAVRTRVPGVRLWLWVEDGSGPCPPWAEPYEAAAEADGEQARGAWGRSGDDQIIVYTGGTTGMPKGVMWRQDDLFVVLTSTRSRRYDDDGDPTEVVQYLASTDVRRVCLPAAPLMHGTGMFACLTQLSDGGSVVTSTVRRFDVADLLDTIDREHVNVLVIVGDAFAKPILSALDAEPDRWDISSLSLIVSSGVMWSSGSKDGLLRHHPGMLLLDQLASSEALGMGRSITGKGRPTGTASFKLGDRTKVITDDGRILEPGSDEVGRLAMKGRNPVGYYKDPVKTDETFPRIDGERWSVPGDYAMVEADGSLRLLGRGSVSINTGGEKVFPEEVEEVVKTVASVRDAVVVGVPHERFGETVVAVVEPAEGATVDADEILAAVGARLATYKVPRRIVIIDSIARAANGKVDYKRLRQFATDQAD